ncbi:AAA family ATPase [Fusarium circinatum]|uniref:AAA family ATPase n=1 Tax=Fusarium circinatum TaxID=48490 RepID=A0A8H5TG45_FUSCI|nr:AAA family ATPase [Fusarium circinatum]
MLEQLPQEILDFITNVLSTEDIKCLSLTSKDLHSATLQAVWESVVIPAWNEGGIVKINLSYLPLNRLLLARHINLRFIAEQYSRICLHSQRLQICGEAADETIVARPAAFNSFEEIIISRLEECEVDHWKSFSWDLGTCIPAPILGTNGIIARQQPALRNLQLITHPFCPQRKTSPETAIDLSAFTHLLSISWRGPDSQNLKTLAIALRNNESHLESLELDLVDWPHMQRELGYQNGRDVVHGLRARDYMNETVFSLDKGSPCIKFPNLHTLVLSHVPLTATLAEAVDFEILKSLTIRSCPQWYDFVLAMAKRKVPVKLRKLELQES